MFEQHHVIVMHSVFLAGTLDSLDSDATAVLASLAYDLAMQGCATQKP